MFEKSTTLKQWFLRHKFLQCLIMAKIDIEEFAKKLKLMKIVALARYWRSWWPFDKALFSVVTKASMTVRQGFLFSGYKGYKGFQWLLTGHYFKCCHQPIFDWKTVPYAMPNIHPYLYHYIGKSSSKHHWMLM